MKDVLGSGGNPGQVRWARLPARRLQDILSGLPVAMLEVG